MKNKGWVRWLIVVVAGALLVGVVGPFVYIHFLKGNEPAPLAAPPTVSAPSSPDTGVTLDGTWKVAGGSQVGYRVQEVLFGQSSIAVGRTSYVTGTFTIAGTAVTDGSFTADLTTLKSSESRRDGQVQGRILQTALYPKATFKLTKPLDLSSISPEQSMGAATATGDLTVHGVTKSVTFDMKGVRSGSQIKITGSIPVVFADYGINHPSGGPAQTKESGLVEFAINFAKGA